jgi:hypothetical protein
MSEMLVKGACALLKTRFATQRLAQQSKKAKHTSALAFSMRHVNHANYFASPPSH